MKLCLISIVTYFYCYDFYDAINYLIDFKKRNPHMKIIFNLSSGIPARKDKPQPLLRLLYEAINLAKENNIIGTIAAGNLDLYYYYPAFYSNIFSNLVTVTGVDHNNERPFYYTQANYINVSAPAKEIYSTLPDYPHLQDTIKNFGRLSGTSMAAPIIAGIAGLILSINNDYEPNLVKKIIQTSTNRFPNFYYDSLYGWGITDVKLAVDLVKARPLNCQVINFNNRPKITWQHNSYNGSGGKYLYNFNKYILYRAIISSDTSTVEYFPVDIIDTNTTYYIDTLNISRRDYLNNLYVKYRVAKINTYYGYESAPSNFAGIWTTGGVPRKISQNNKKITLLNNYPNPFNNSTNISFELSEDDLIAITIYNSLGQLVYSSSDFRLKGLNSINIKFNNLPTGVYFYKLETKNETLKDKLIYVK